MTNQFEVILEKTFIGNKLTLSYSKKGRLFTRWKLVDEFNGENGYVSVNEPLYGFYSVNRTVELHLLDNKGKEAVYKNTQIVEKKKEGSSDV